MPVLPPFPNLSCNFTRDCSFPKGRSRFFSLFLSFLPSNKRSEVTNKGERSIFPFARWRGRRVEQSRYDKSLGRRITQSITNFAVSTPVCVSSVRRWWYKATVESRETSARPSNFTGTLHTFPSVSLPLSLPIFILGIASVFRSLECMLHWWCTSMHGSSRKRFALQERSAERHRLFPRSLQDCKFRASGVHGAARSLARWKWLLVECRGWKKVVFAGVEIQRSGVARTSYPGEGVPNQGFLCGLSGNQPISHGQFLAVPDVQSPPPSTRFLRYRSAKPRLCVL